MTQSEFVPERGDAIWIDFNPRVGHEQAGRRPALILSPRSYNGRLGLAILCPITRQIKGYPFEVVLPEGLAVSGAVLSDQIKSLDWRARGAERVASIPDDVVQAVLSKLGALFPVSRPSHDTGG